MNEADWERWIETFDGFDEKLQDRAKSLGDKAMESLVNVLDTVDDRQTRQQIETAIRQFEEALDEHAELAAKSASVISDMDDELDYLKPIAAERLAEQFALPLETGQHKAIMEWCEENLQSHYWHYRMRQTRVLVITEDNEKVMFKLRWGDTIPDLMP